MTIEEAIEILRKNRPTSDTRPCGMELCDSVDMAISALRQREHPQWISVKYRLPDTCVCVLVHYDDGNILIDEIGSDGEWMDEDFNCGNITHWMPLPEPPEEDDHA